MESQFLKPRKRIISAKGKLYYSESFSAWNSLRFRKQLLDEFPQLKEKRSSFSYKMVLYTDYLELDKSFRKLRRDKEAIPILMWIVKEKPIN